MIRADDFVIAAMVDDGVLSPEAAERANKYAREHACQPRDAVVALALAPSRTVALFAAQVSEYPFVDPECFDIDYNHASLLPRATAERLRAFPLFVTDGIATVGMLDPLDLRAVDQLRTCLKLDIDPVLCEPDALAGLIERAYSITGSGARASAPRDRDEPDDPSLSREPVVLALNEILAQAIELGASDIHLGPDERELHLRYRVDGGLLVHRGPALDMHQGLVQRLKIMAGLDVTQTRRPQDGKFRFTHNGRSVDVRLALIPTVSGENAVMRILSSAASIRGFAELGMPPAMIRRFEQSIDSPHGMVLVSGPTGSGKTTTLYTALKHLNSADLNIMTIEDPVEIRMPLIRQVQTNPDIGLTFAGALRSILRQDPDVVFVGEIRDEETARICVQAALTGHLVLSSIHTNDAASAIPRLRDLNCPGFAINAALLCVLAQRLIKRVCPDCAHPAQPAPDLAARFGLAPTDTGFVQAAGCARCGHLGTRGRMGIYEFLELSPAIRRLIDADATLAQISDGATREGMRLMWQDGLDKARVGLTTLDEISRVFAVQSVEDAPAPTRRAA
ncbi:MAG: secretion system protein E [Tepidisphaera sp.]|nr:secretion system protein E [Tepidisphaera sp.]